MQASAIDFPQLQRGERTAERRPGSCQVIVSNIRKKFPIFPSVAVLTFHESNRDSYLLIILLIMNYLRKLLAQQRPDAGGRLEPFHPGLSARSTGEQTNLIRRRSGLIWPGRDVPRCNLLYGSHSNCSPSVSVPRKTLLCLMSTHPVYILDTAALIIVILDSPVGFNGLCETRDLQG